jgi:GAF domain-containing protein
VSSTPSLPVEQALARLKGSPTVPTLLHATARELVGLLDAQRCAISRAVGDLLVEVTAHQVGGETTPQLDLYLASDYPLTQEVLERGEPRLVSRDAEDADPAEADLLRRLGFAELLMLPLSAHGSRWGLVEVYASERPFGPREVAVAQELLHGAEKLLGALEPA